MKLAIYSVHAESTFFTSFAESVLKTSFAVGTGEVIYYAFAVCLQNSVGVSAILRHLCMHPKFRRVDGHQFGITGCSLNQKSLWVV